MGKFTDEEKTMLSKEALEEIYKEAVELKEILSGIQTAEDVINFARKHDGANGAFKIDALAFDNGTIFDAEEINGMYRPTMYRPTPDFVFPDYVPADAKVVDIEFWNNGGLIDYPSLTKGKFTFDINYGVITTIDRLFELQDIEDLKDELDSTKEMD